MSVVDIIAEVDKLSVTELNELVTALEGRWGVSANAPVSIAIPGEQVTALVEQTEFDAVLTEIGPEKIKVIKVVRELTSLSLMEAKTLVESAPKAIKTAISRLEAEQIQGKMREVGAKVTIQ